MSKITSALYAVALSLAVAAVAAPASAQDHEWSGFYVGLNAGGTTIDSEARTTTVYSPSGYFAASSVPAVDLIGDQEPNDTGFTGGVTAGYNWRLDNVVLGFETDLNTGDAEARESLTMAYPCCAPSTLTVQTAVSSDWTYTLRGRAGFVVSPNVLVYGTAGVTVADVNADFLFTDTYATAHESASVSTTKTGWTAGLGAEYALEAGWSIKAEYLYADLGKVSRTSTNLTAFSGPTAYPTNVFSHSAELRTDTIRLGLNYKF